MAETTLFAGGSQRYFGDALKNFKKATELMHAVSGAAALCAFVTDLLELKFHNATALALGAFLVTAVAAWGLGRAGRIAQETSDNIVSFTIIPAIVLSGLFVIHTVFGVPSVVQKIVQELTNQQHRAYEKLTTEQRALVDEISAALGVPLDALAQRLLTISASQEAKNQADTVNLLRKFADQYLRAVSATVSADDPEVRALLTAADGDFANGQVGPARLKLRQAAEMERMAATNFTNRSSSAINTAASALEHSGKFAEMTARYADAAEDFSDGARLVAGVDSHRSWQLTRDQAQVLYKQGVEYHDEAAARQAVDLCNGLVTKAAESHWDVDVQQARMDLDLANASLSHILGKTTETAPPKPPIEHKHARAAIHVTRPNTATTQKSVQKVPDPSPPVTQQPEPVQADGSFFARLTGWIGGGNPSQGTSQSVRRPTPSLVQPVSRPSLTGTALRKRHERVVRKSHASNP